MTSPVVVVHGGAGNWPAERLEAGLQGCRRAAEAGAVVIGDGAPSAVVAAVKVLEDDPSFNAGKGSTLTRDGTVELDAAVMTGDLRFGAVAACPPISSGVEAALAVYEDGEHSLLAGEAAAEFAERAGVGRLGPEDLVVDRVRRLFEERRKEGAGEGEAGATVGAVALDASGRLAAATSTGGIFYKRRGRVGDTPLPGAGTYADEALGAAVSATGEGESILRVLLSREVAERVHRGVPIEVAAAEAMGILEERAHGRAGLIAVDRSGSFAAFRNTPAMPWAACRPGEPPTGGP